MVLRNSVQEANYSSEGRGAAIEEKFVNSPFYVNK